MSEGLDELNREFEGFLRLYRDGDVLEIRMIKGKVNAICRRFSRYMERAAVYLQNDLDLRVGILSSGSDKAFSAGLDFNEATAPLADEPAPGAVRGGFGGITTLWALKKPLIAAINAPAVGGGLELALACDILLMADGAYFQLPELQRGLLPDGGGLQRLTRRIPYHIATAMIWTGDRMTASEAHRWGLVYQVAEPADLTPLAWNIARRVARGAPLAQQALKETLRFVSGLSDEAAMSLRRDSQGDLANYRQMLSSQDMIEGQRAFLEKREPKWLGH